MLTTIRNAQAVKKETVKFPYSKIKFNLAKLLENEGFISNVEAKGVNKKMVITASLKYRENGQPQITNLRRLSKPGQRLYVSYKDVRSVKGGYGKVILSTPKGLLTGDEAKKQKVGGEFICEVW
ncbi:MAG: 30S ribosomal protein S8 [Candidatus Spechtbacteria bacterium RIFCSPLOWO2_02_FULL_38_8]|uniref:Small ribosomal subunit protein uS8 n=1 Tax=Candidatus Spechtbacteria bacterium RIFCSPLOWO2_02_FULL_38_8 TaxID=1802164 RepID=A0A1G2HGG3_9BACT|nr:MAG: 30S ribosomal protein S8 [Candidatus Spechtbacteria bacterium RIFCSPLOWO2_02_FULL_38_8]